MAKLITTLGPKDAAELGMILPHEHVFVDLHLEMARRDAWIEYDAVGSDWCDEATIRKLTHTNPFRSFAR